MMEFKTTRLTKTDIRPKRNNVLNGRFGVKEKPFRTEKANLQGAQ